MKLMRGFLTLVGLLTALGMAGVAIAVAILWWQDRQWQAQAGQEDR